MRIFIFSVALAAMLSACGGHKIETGGSTPGTGGGQTNSVPTSSTEPRFVKEGRLQIFSSRGDTLSSVDIEIAATDAEREQGLMFRTSIAENTGMLFLFDETEMQSFWMKNTPSSLDILFISPDNRIINIHKYTSPYSIEGLPSTAPSNKVLELVAGYCDKHKVKPGDKIAYQFAGNKNM